MCPDPTSLEHQVINNLISNAIKFSFVGGEIIVTVAGNNGSITSCVRDYGTGMPDDVLHKIFDTREPTTRVGTANEKGTGFAMPVVHSYIELYGGKISVKSWPRHASKKFRHRNRHLIPLSQCARGCDRHGGLTDYNNPIVNEQI